MQKRQRGGGRSEGMIVGKEVKEEEERRCEGSRGEARRTRRRRAGRITAAGDEKGNEKRHFPEQPFIGVGVL